MEDFLSKKECEYLIEVFNKSKNLVSKHKNRYRLKVDPINLLTKINKQFNFYNFLKPDNCEIVMWPPSSSMDMHIDEGDKMSFLLYLNDNFDGGETVVEDVIVKPKQGKILIFSNGIMKHKVKKIKKNNRFMLAGWYK
tara:strand:+ start:135 stop:548 length:414 start_codon:yes stop_codon:yes gene_type:complete